MNYCLPCNLILSHLPSAPGPTPIKHLIALQGLLARGPSFITHPGQAQVQQETLVLAYTTRTEACVAHAAAGARQAAAAIPQGRLPGPTWFQPSDVCPCTECRALTLNPRLLYLRLHGHAKQLLQKLLQACEAGSQCHLSDVCPYSGCKSLNPKP